MIIFQLLICKIIYKSLYVKNCLQHAEEKKYDVNMCFLQRKMIKMTNYNLMDTETEPIP